MLVSILLGAILFGYAGWTLIRYIRRSREGKCAACELNKNCNGSCAGKSDRTAADRHPAHQPVRPRK